LAVPGGCEVARRLLFRRSMAPVRRHDIAIDDAPTICVRTQPEQALAVVRPPLFALVLAPGAPPQPFALARTWVTMGGPSDDIPLGAAGEPGQIVLRPQGEQVFLE